MLPALLGALVLKGASEVIEDPTLARSIGKSIIYEVNELAGEVKEFANNYKKIEKAKVDTGKKEMDRAAFKGVNRFNETDDAGKAELLARCEAVIAGKFKPSFEEMQALVASMSSEVLNSALGRNIVLLAGLNVWNLDPIKQGA